MKESLIETLVRLAQIVFFGFAACGLVASLLFAFVAVVVEDYKEAPSFPRKVWETVKHLVRETFG